MSRTLGRIRRVTGDRILVRSGRVMLPTPYAEAIRDQVHHLVGQAQAVLLPVSEVDPATLERTFTIQCNDVVAAALLPRLATALLRDAPGVCLRVIGEPHTTTDELRQGRIDLQITDEAPPHTEIRSATVLTDELAVIGRRDLPRDPSGWAAFAALPHVVISRRGRRRNRVDDLLEARGLRRNVSFTVPTVALALPILAGHPLIAVVPGQLTEQALPSTLRRYPMPGPPSSVPAVLAWHVRHDQDPAHRWFRTRVTDVFGAVTA